MHTFKPKKLISNAILITLILITAGLFTTGCAMFSSSEIDKPDVVKEKEIVWPFPPDEPRIRYIKSLHGETDVIKKTKKTIWHKIFEVITGFIFGNANDQVRLIRPYGIVEKDDIIYIADQELGVVHIFDFKLSEYLQIGNSKYGPLASPIGVTVDDNDNLYVSDSVHNKVFVYNADRMNTMVIGEDGRFSRPTGLAINNDEKLLYVVDTIANKILVFDLDGKFKFEFGQRGEKTGTDLNFPINIFLDKDGKVYICDSMNFKVKIFEKDGTFISMFGKLGDKLGYFSRPKGIAVDSEGHIYVVESLFDRVQIFDNTGRLLLVFGNSGTGKGQFWLPSGIFIDSKDRVYVADAYNKRVQIFQYLKTKEKLDQNVLYESSQIIN